MFGGRHARQLAVLFGLGYGPPSQLVALCSSCLCCLWLWSVLVSVWLCTIVHLSHLYIMYTCHICALCTHVTFVHTLCHAAARQTQPLLRLPQSQAAAGHSNSPRIRSQTTARAHATAPRGSRTSARQPHKHGGRGQRSACEQVAAGAGGQHAVESNKQAQWLADEHCRCRV